VSFFCALFFTTQTFAQISAGGAPPSFGISGALSSPPTVKLSAPSRDDLIGKADQEWKDAIEKNDVIPWQIAEPLPVSLNLKNSGQWETFADGSRLWRLRIQSPDAEALWFIYDRWWLPKDARLFIYNDDQSEVIGAFTSDNNFPLDSSNVTSPVLGDALTLEYYLPPDAPVEGELSIMTVLHGFRGFDRKPTDPLDAYGESGPCQVDINCPDGADWQLQKHAVCVLFMPGGGTCSGALINNYASNGIPYVLTARHCLPDGFATGWSARFKYESPTCGGVDGPYNFTLANAYVRARWENTDFLLLEFFNTPPLTYEPYYAGWDRSGIGALNTAGIHHPMADVKKISKDNLGPYSTDWNGDFDGYHWGVHWDIGRTQPGSSGSPLFSNDGLIIGELHGGMSECPSEDQPDKYGKFSGSYYGVDGSDASNRLHEWLNPYGIAGNTMAGYYPGPPSNDECSNAWSIYSLPYASDGYTNFADVDYTNCTSNSSPQVWFRLPPFGCPRQITIDLCGSNFDTEVQVWRGTCSQIFEIIGCNDDGVPACVNGDPLPSRFTFTTLQNEEYLIAVSGHTAASMGHYQLLVTGTQLTPANDNNCNAVVINSFPFSYSGNTSCATNVSTPPCSFDPPAPDVEFSLIPPCDMNLRISTCGSDFDTALELRVSPESFPDCQSAFEYVACSEDHGFTCPSNPYATLMNVSVLANRHYKLILDGFAGASGNYTLTVTGTLAGDACPGTVIPSLPYVTPYGANTLCGTDNTPPGSPSGLGEGARDLVYSYTPTSCHVCRVSLCGSNYDTALLVYVGACAAENLQAYNDDFCGPYNYQSQLDFNARLGYTYYIYVDGFGTDAGEFIMNVSDVGPFTESVNGCSGLNIASLPFVSSGSTLCATSVFTASHCDGAASNDVIYAMNLPECAYVTATLCGSGYDTRLAVLSWDGTGSSCPGNIPVFCNDDSYCGETYTLQSTASFLAQANTLYRFLIHGFNGAAGPYVLNVTSGPCDLPAPTEFTTSFDPATGDITLAWNAVDGADNYYIYASATLEDLFAPEHFLIDVPGASYSFCCIEDFGEQQFFGVIADNYAVLASAALADNRGDSLPKEAAVQGPIAEEFSFDSEIDNPELAPQDKAVMVNPHE
jgi:hypothetical protein